MFDSLWYWALFICFAGLAASLPRVAKDWLLIAGSGLACALLDLRGFLILLILVCFTGWVLDRGRRHEASGLKTHAPFTVGVSAVLMTLLFFKYLPGAPWTSDGLLGRIALPLGISFLSFRLIHVLIEERRGTLPEYTPREFLLYTVFFPIWVAGPIQRLDEFLRDRIDVPDMKMAVHGALRIGVGIVKAFLISDQLLPMAYADGQDPANVVAHLSDASSLDVWRYLLITYFVLYLDFSGYCDMAIGSSRMLGFKIAENFCFPFLATSMSDYWRRWHMSLARWCQSYVYLPVLARTRNATLPLFATFLTMGVWHAASPNWVMWGLWHASGIYAYRQWDKLARRVSAQHGRDIRLAAPVGNVLTLGYVICAGAFTSLHHVAPINESFNLLTRAFGF